jgi:hypothetical protein
VPRSKNEWSYTYTPPIRLHGVVLSKSIGTLPILPLFIILNTSEAKSRLGKVVSREYNPSTILLPDDLGKYDVH